MVLGCGPSEQELKPETLLFCGWRRDMADMIKVLLFPHEFRFGEGEPLPKLSLPLIFCPEPDDPSAPTREFLRIGIPEEFPRNFRG